MITKLRNILGLSTLEESLNKYQELNEEMETINSKTDDLADVYYSRMKNYNDILKSNEYSDEIKKSVKTRFDAFLSDQKASVVGLVNRRHKIEKELSKLLKNDNLSKAVQELNAIEKAKENYKQNKISKSVYNDIIKAKKGKVHYSDNFVFWNDKLLIIQRTTDDSNANTWVLPGGHVDAGEGHEEAAIRELQEETGIESKTPVLAGKYENDDVMIEYYTTIIESETEPSILLDTFEHQSYKWIDLYSELDNYEFPFNMKENIEKILLPEKQDEVKILKAVNMFTQGLISKQVLSDIVKARTGRYADNPTNRRLKRVGQQYGTKGTQDIPEQKEGKKEPETNKKQSGEQSIEEYARQSSETALQNAAKGGDEELRIAAKKELDRREKEESVPDRPDESVSGDTEKKTEKETPSSDKKGLTVKDKVEELSDKYRDFVRQSMDDDFSNPNKTEDLSKKQKEYARYIQRVKEFDEINKEEHLKKAQELLGLKSEKEVKDFFGDGEIIGVKVDDGVVSVLSEDCYCQRDFSFGTVEMLEFIINPDLDKGQGKGTDIFYNQVQSFKKKGYEDIITEAAKSDIYNGYYTWARLGYDFSRGSDERKFERLMEDAFKAKDISKEVKSLPELMSFPEGRKFWKENGFAFSGTMSLTESSKSMFILNKYMEDKKNAKK